MRFGAKLSVAQAWTVTVPSSAGVEIAQGSGTGLAVDWTWDGSAAPPDRYTWTIASPSARSATGTLGGVAALAVQQPSAAPAEVAPGETTTLAYTLTTPAVVTVTLVSPASQVLSTLLVAAKPAGRQTLTLTPPPGLLNGQYTAAISAVAGAKTATAAIPFLVDDVVTGLAASGTSLGFTLTRAPFSLAFQVLHAGTVVAVPTVPVTVPGAQSLTWDKLLAGGTRAPDGLYTLALTVTDEFGTFTRTAGVTLDTRPPAIRVLSYRTLRFRIGEAATLDLTVGTHVYTRVVRKPATTQFWLKAKPSQYTLTATDAAGNRSIVRYRR